jgi:hypothetical protein
MATRRHPSVIRAAAGAVLLVAAASVFLAAAAGASTRVLAHWKVTIKGTVRHTWSLPSSEPCDATGDGSVRASFHSVAPERITIADNGFGAADTTWTQIFQPIKGSVTAVDNRTRNPPPADGSCDAGPVPDTRACGTRQIDTNLFVESPLGDARLYRLEGGDLTRGFIGKGNAADCETDGLQDFSSITGANGRSHQPFELHGYPTDARLASAHGPIVVSVSQTRRFNPTSETFREVRIVFTRVS